MKFEVDQSLLNAIADYLSKRPWIEVKDLIAALQRLKPLEAAELKDKKP